MREKTYFKSPKIAQILRNVIPLFVVCGGLSTLSPLPSHSKRSNTLGMRGAEDITFGA